MVIYLQANYLLVKNSSSNTNTLLLAAANLKEIQTLLNYFLIKKRFLRLNSRIGNKENFNFDKKYPLLFRNISHFTELNIFKSS